MDPAPPDNFVSAQHDKLVISNTLNESNERATGEHEAQTANRPARFRMRLRPQRLQFAQDVLQRSVNEQNEHAEHEDEERMSDGDADSRFRFIPPETLSWSRVKRRLRRFPSKPHDYFVKLTPKRGDTFAMETLFSKQLAERHLDWVAEWYDENFTQAEQDAGIVRVAHLDTSNNTISCAAYFIPRKQFARKKYMRTF